MAFRRNKQKAKAWKEWLSRNSDELIRQCSVPAEIVNYEQRWWYLEHHGIDGISGWTIEMLSDTQMERLYELMVRELGEEGFLHVYLTRAIADRRAAK